MNFIKNIQNTVFSASVAEGRRKMSNVFVVYIACLRAEGKLFQPL